jgi:phage shock protein PspC (stress-responsive transcriptional regulator)
MTYGNTPRRLVRLPADGKIAGVCAGLAAYLDVDVALIRLAWVVLSIVPGGIVGGVVAYVVAWAVVPDAPGTPAPPVGRRLERSATNVQIAGVCAGIAEYFGADPTVVRVIWAVLTIMPGAIVLGVLAYAVAWAIMPRAAVPPPVQQPAPSSTPL